jgi:uncharacterized repeat protein (TIGR01451 family)
MGLTNSGLAGPSRIDSGADLQLRVDRVPGSIGLGNPFKYVFRVRNKGPAQATSVTLRDQIPAQVTLVSKKASQGSCSGSAALKCSLGRLKVGRAAAVTVVVKAKAAGRGVNRASVSALQHDPRPSDNRLSVATVVQAAPVTGTPDVTVTVNRSSPIGPAQLAVGITNTFGTFAGPNGDANARAEDLLRQVAVFQNQHVDGFGAMNPEPSPGAFQWQSLDRRIGVIRSTGGIPIITLCCAPDWMTSPGTNTGRPGRNRGRGSGGSGSSFLPPAPAHYGDFAQLAQQVARRYPDVKYYDVWNQLKGFNGNYVAYTNFYNVVYDALKAVDPTIKVGGPYLPVSDGGQGPPPELQVFRYWLANAHGADFVSFTHSIVAFREQPPDPATILSQTAQFETITKQIRALTSLPIWWVEDYFDGDLRRLSYASDAFQAAALASILYHEELGGATVSLRWQPEGIANQPFGGDQESLWSDTAAPSGGQPFPSFYVYKAFHDDFPPGTRLYAATSSSPDVEALASATRTLLINKSNAAHTVSLDGGLVALAPYQVKLV